MKGAVQPAHAEMRPGCVGVMQLARRLALVVPGMTLPGKVREVLLRTLPAAFFLVLC